MKYYGVGTIRINSIELAVGYVAWSEQILYADQELARALNPTRASHIAALRKQTSSKDHLAAAKAATRHLPKRQRMICARLLERMRRAATKPPSVQRCAILVWRQLK